MEDERTVRVLPGPEETTLRLLDRETYDPVVVETDVCDHAEDLLPGYLIDATLDWSDPKPALSAFTLVRPTLYTFVEEADPMFEVAQDVWQEARASGDGMNSRVTRSTDGEVNGVCYVFADGALEDRFGEFRDGTRPIDPLVDRVNETDEPAPREVFVLQPVGGEFVVVTIALSRGGHFAETLRETYGADHPSEPLV